jgi:hypothetical protein
VCILLSVVYHVLGFCLIGSMNIDATAWMVNYKEELFLAASSVGGKVWSASFCVPVRALFAVY